MRKLFFLLLGFAIITDSCKKNTLPDIQEDHVFVDSLSDTEASVINSLPDTTFSLQDIYLDNDQSVKDFLLQHDPSFIQNYPSGRGSHILSPSAEEQRQTFLSEMLCAGNFLCKDSSWGTINPLQIKLAYSWGSKDFNVLQIPPGAGAECIDRKIKGLDCSGMIYQMAKASSLNLAAWSSQYETATEYYGDTSAWNTTFRNSPKYSDLLVEDEGQISPSEIKVGDIIIWPKKHIGIVLNNRAPYIFMSRGYKSKPRCQQNLGHNKGPVCVSLRSIDWTRYLDGIYKILRVKCKCGETSSVRDIDGNKYDVIKIGTQCWMKENLKTTRYRNGDPISTGLNDAAWASATSGAYAIYDNSSANNSIYGKLYNWYAVNDLRNIAPLGWHVPSNAEWIILMNYLGGPNIAGGSMKETGFTHWQSPNTGATNESGFTGLPGSERSDNGAFVNIGYRGLWWSSAQDGFFKAVSQELVYFYPFTGQVSDWMTHGWSVRCVKD